MSEELFKFEILWAGWECDYKAEVRDGKLYVSGKEWSKSDLEERIKAYAIALRDAEKALGLMNGDLEK